MLVAHETVADELVLRSLQGEKVDFFALSYFTVESPNSHTNLNSHTLVPHENVTIWVRKGFQKKNSSEFRK